MHNASTSSESLWLSDRAGPEVVEWLLQHST
jgi:hypothetical protein